MDHFFRLQQVIGLLCQWAAWSLHAIVSLFIRILGNSYLILRHTNQIPVNRCMCNDRKSSY